MNTRTSNNGEQIQNTLDPDDKVNEVETQILSSYKELCREDPSPKVPLYCLLEIMLFPSILYFSFIA